MVDHVKDAMLGVDIDAVVVEQLEFATYMMMVILIYSVVGSICA
jgi:hypothetical protein